MNLKKMRLHSGSSLIELPVTMWVLFIMFFVPLVDLATICLRTAYFYSAVHAASLDACRANSLTQEVDHQRPAVTLAKESLTRRVMLFRGLELKQIKLFLVRIDTATREQQVYPLGSTPPVLAADSASSIYQLQIVASASISPLLPMKSTAFVNIPGITAAIPFSVSDQQYIENPQGLLL